MPIFGDKQSLEQVQASWSISAFLHYYFGLIWYTTKCSAWHSWKGIPESALQWLAYFGFVKSSLSDRFAYNCNTWFEEYSKVVAALVSPFFGMMAFAHIRLFAEIFVRVFKKSTPRPPADKGEVDPRTPHQDVGADPQRTVDH
jgi:hypothetical protein